MYLGIEIGGTKLQLGIGDGAGAIHAIVRDTIVQEDGADGIRRQIERAIPELLANPLTPGPSPTRGEGSILRGVGIGFGGPVDDGTRTVIKSHQIAGWDGFALADWVENIVGLPAVLGNDADVAGLAEALFGAGKGLSPIFYITIGSGIGGGLIINGEIYRGCGRGAAEIGHMEILIHHGGSWPDSVLVEDNASGWAIARAAAYQLDRIGYQSSKDCVLWDWCNWQTDRITSKDVARAAAAGDRLSLAVLDDAWTGLAQGIDQMISMVCPRRIVIGGGVALMGEKLLFEPLRQKVAERVFKPFAGCCDIVPAALGEAVVVHGALALAPSGSIDRMSCNQLKRFR